MSQEYLLFSEALALDEEETERAEQVAWLQQALAPVRPDDDEEDDEQDVAKRRENLKKIGVATDRFVDLDSWPDFSFKFCDEEDEPHLWVYSTESGDLDQVVALVQAFLKKFYPDKGFGLQWASTCSRPLLGAFGGGAVYVTADGAKFANTRTALRRFAQEDGKEET